VLKPIPEQDSSKLQPNVGYVATISREFIAWIKIKYCALFSALDQLNVSIENIVFDNISNYKKLF